ncbi:MAG: spore germination protein [Defluviitaleaceae bacterium]|nr:spore germination protein [Defluviitaleaceae bacterium]
MIWFNDKISIRQMQILIIINIFGTGIVALPRFVTSYSSSDGWISVFIASLFVAFCVFIITTLGNMYPDKSFYEYTSILLNKPIGVILSIGFVVRLILHTSFTIRIAIEIVGDMLPNTSKWFLALFIILISGFAASKGYETRARLAEILIFLIFIPIIFVFAIAAFNVDYTNILPFWRLPSEIFQGSFYSISSFAMIELLLLVYPYINNRENVRKNAVLTIIILGIIMSIVTLITIARFDIHHIPYIRFPIIQIMDSTNLPGSFLQRQSLFIMSFFILSVFATINACLFFSSLILKSVVKKGKHSYYIFVCMMVSFFITFFLKDIDTVYTYFYKSFLYIGMAYMFFIPLILLIFSKIKYGKNIKISVILIFLIPFLTSCNKIEMEERIYVSALGIDKVEDDYLLTIGVYNKDDIDEIQIRGTTIQDAIGKIEENTSKILYLGITQAILFGYEILKDTKSFSNVINTLNGNTEISSDVYILATKNPEEILKKIDGNDSIFSKYHKSSKIILNQLDQKTLEGITSSIYRINSTMIPIVNIKNDMLEIEGMGIVNKNESLEIIDKKYIQGYLLLLGNGENTKITLKKPKNTLTIDKIDRKLHFENIDGDVYVNVDLKIKPTFENDFNNYDYFIDIYKNVIASMVVSSFYKIMQNKPEYDFAKIRDYMRKKDTQLFEDTRYKDMKINVSVLFYD